MEDTRQFRIPGRLNQRITLGLVAGLLTFQWVASHTSSWLLVGLSAVAFAAFMIPVYTLMHEAMHKVYHHESRTNYLGGVVLTLLFGGSFTFIRATHMGHHRRNRTDAEMFDCYYPHESKIAKQLFLYVLMSGLYWVSIPLVVIVAALLPGFVYRRLAKRSNPMGTMLAGIEPSWYRRIRFETALMVVVHIALFHALDLSLVPYLCLYAVHAVSWSSQNYVNHAFSERDVLNGAHNLRMHPWVQKFYLNFNLHLAHHQQMHLPWTELPNHVDPARYRPSYLENYLRLWAGPVLTTEPAPKSRDAAFEAELQHAA